MNLSLPLSLTLGCFIVLAADRTALAEPKGPDLKITLRAYNNASVPTEMLISAQRNVTRVFAKIGVTAAWLDSAPREEQMFGTGLEFGIIILDRSSGERIVRSKNALGSTPRGEVGNPGHMAYIFYDRVEDFTRFVEVRSVVKTDIRQVLAFAIAHELGHLLLPDDSHSLIGIMRGSWGLGDFTLMATGHLDFIPEQAWLIRNQVLCRSR